MKLDEDIERYRKAKKTLIDEVVRVTKVEQIVNWLAKMLNRITNSKHS